MNPPSGAPAAPPPTRADHQPVFAARVDWYLGPGAIQLPSSLLPLASLYNHQFRPRATNLCHRQRTARRRGPMVGQLLNLALDDRGVRRGSDGSVSPFQGKPLRPPFTRPRPRAPRLRPLQAGGPESSCARSAGRASLGERRDALSTRVAYYCLQRGHQVNQQVAIVEHPPAWTIRRQLPQVPRSLAPLPQSTS